MDEMERRGYRPDPKWRVPYWRGDKIGHDRLFGDADFVDDQYCYATHKGGVIYPEHDNTYLKVCVDLLKEKEAPIDWALVEEKLHI